MTIHFWRCKRLQLNCQKIHFPYNNILSIFLHFKHILRSKNMKESRTFKLEHMVSQKERHQTTFAWTQDILTKFFDAKKAHYVTSKSLYKSCAGRHFYGRENVIWAGFGPVGNTEKKMLGQLWATFEAYFSCFHGQKTTFIF